jgi:hypothetical protein
MVTPGAEPTGNGDNPAQNETESTVEQSSEATQSERMFAQDDVNRMMATVRREERSKFADYTQLKDRAARADELEQAQLTEQEKLTQRATEAERLATEATSQMASVAISAEVRVQAVQLGVVDPDAAYLLMDRNSVSYDPATGVTGAKEALTRLLEEKPYLRGTPARTPNINPEGGQPAPVTRLTEDQREAARLMGITEEEYAQGI